MEHFGLQFSVSIHLPTKKWIIDKELSDVSIVLAHQLSVTISANFQLAFVHCLFLMLCIIFRSMCSFRLRWTLVYDFFVQSLCKSAAIFVLCNNFYVVPVSRTTVAFFLCAFYHARHTSFSLSLPRAKLHSHLSCC